jgi:hypothetical protein
MVPKFLGQQLLTAEPGIGEEAKIQRNTQAEILAILTAILTWSTELEGKDVMIVTDSSATQGNLLSGSSSDAHSQELVSLLAFVLSAKNIQVWVQWLPSKQNPGDPFSRPLTDQKEAFAIAKAIGAEWTPPIMPPTIVQSAHARGIAMQSSTGPSSWSTQDQLAFVAELGALDAKDLGKALLAAVRPLPEGQPILRLGYWKRTSQMCSATRHHPHLVRMLLHQAELFAPGKGISWMLILQDVPLKLPSVEHSTCHLRIDIDKNCLNISTQNDSGAMSVVACCPLASDRRLTVVLGSDKSPLPPVILMKLQRLGFSLRNVQPLEKVTVGKKGRPHQLRK